MFTLMDTRVAGHNSTRGAYAPDGREALLSSVPEHDVERLNAPRMEGTDEFSKDVRWREFLVVIMLYRRKPTNKNARL